MERREFIKALGGAAAVGSLLPHPVPAVSLEWLCAALKVVAADAGPFEGTLMFDPVTLDQKPFTWPLWASTWDEAFAESDRIRDWFAGHGYSSWSVGTKGPMHPVA